MGNLIKSCESKFERTQRKYAKTLPSHTALGKFSTININEKLLIKKLKNKIDSQKSKKKKEGNELFWIYRELFTPVQIERRNFKLRETHIYSEENKSMMIDDEHNNKYNGYKRKIILKHPSKLYILQNETHINNDSEIYQSIKKTDCTNTIDSVYNNETRISSEGCDELRRSYLAKLILKKIWQPTRRKNHHNSIIIFDWDDTLLCTSFLTPNGIYEEDNPISDIDWDKIRKLEICVLKVLQLAINKGQTYIITNAALGWVQYSARKFFPGILKILERVKIISARNEYEKIYPGDCRQWKILTFLKVSNDIDKELVTNLICIGDSHIEVEAAHLLAANFKKAYIKTVKFKHSPKINELNKQINLLIEQFNKIFSSVKNMNIKVSKKHIDGHTDQ